ncbi:MAG TPA: protein kinase [Chloroflexia bacterium]
MSDNNNSTPMIEGGRLLADRYRLLEKIGEGGAAEVFRAKDQRLDRIIAIKVLRPQFTHDPASRKRFVTEARVAARLSHPNIVDIYDFGEAPGDTMFISMKYVEGQNLKDVLQKRGRLTPAETISIARQACHALSAAHAAELIHRDVKPQNILIDRAGNVNLTDFGIVKALSGPSLTQSGMTFGTAAYMSPEQATGSPIGPASDIYALGCVMYDMLTGRPPFEGDNPAIVAYKQVWEQPRPLHDLVPEVPPSLEAVVMRCLNKDPGRRYPDTRTLAAELDAISAMFNQPTQAMSLGSIMGTNPNLSAWLPAGQRPAAELSQAVPMPAAPGSPAAVPPVKAQSTTFSSVPVQQVTPPPRSAAPYAAQPPARGVQVNVARQRRIGWLPVTLLVAAGLVLCGLLGAWQGRDIWDNMFGATSPTPSPTLPVAVVIPELSPTITIPPVLPGDTPAPPPTETAIPPTEAPPTPVRPTEVPPTQAPPTEVPPTETLPPPVPTNTPEPPSPATPPEPTITPEPPADTPVPSDEGGRIRLDDNAFVGGFTNANRLYHGVTAMWVYGQRTAYSSMSATFSVVGAPAGPAALTIRGVDAEGAAGGFAKIPIRITLNDTVLHDGPNPFPDDFANAGKGEGNWGLYTWDLAPGLLHEGSNTLTITNLTPDNRINYPMFFMLDYAIITWGP